MNLNSTGKESSSQLGSREINLVLLKMTLVRSKSSWFAFYTLTQKYRASWCTVLSIDCAAEGASE